MVQRRVDGHPGRLVDDNEVFVLEYDVQGKTDRRNLLGASGFAYLDLKAVACRKLLAHIVMNAVYKDALGHPLDFCQVLAGIAPPP